jgi:hypothetical protein
MKKPREWQPALAHRKVRSNTGFAGITRSDVGGRPALRVSWRTDRNVRKATTIYFTAGDEASYRRALESAQALRFEQLARRMKREGRIVPC